MRTEYHVRSCHFIRGSKRDVVEVVTTIEQRGAPVAANKALKAIKTFPRWCVGRAVQIKPGTAGYHSLRARQGSAVSAMSVEAFGQ